MIYYLLNAEYKKRETIHETKIVKFIQKYFDNDNKSLLNQPLLPTIVKDR